MPPLTTARAPEGCDGDAAVDPPSVDGLANAEDARSAKVTRLLQNARRTFAVRRKKRIFLMGELLISVTR
jgi:hypothetical protein